MAFFLICSILIQAAGGVCSNAKVVWFAAEGSSLGSRGLWRGARGQKGILRVDFSKEVSCIGKLVTVFIKAGDMKPVPIAPCLKQRISAKHNVLNCNFVMTEVATYRAIIEYDDRGSTNTLTPLPLLKVVDGSGGSGQTGSSKPKS